MTGSAHVTVDANDVRGPMSRPWTSVGYDEINWTSMPAGRRLLADIGGFGDRGYHVRAHYVFNSGSGFGLPHWGSGNVYHEDAAGNPHYDFTIVDQTYDAVVAGGHYPLVELAFTPLDLVPDHAKDDFSFQASPSTYSAYEAGWWTYPPKDYSRWGDLVAALVAHCRDRYGRDSVTHWLWELWNEPDISYWKGTPEEFYALYDVTAAAVRRELPEARVGGPAVTGGDGGVPFLRGFLEHCAASATPLDFVSFHTKGAAFEPWRTYAPDEVRPVSPQSPSLGKMLHEVRRLLDVVNDSGVYAGIPCVIDECDASVPAHWGCYDNPNFAYRNTEYYPVFQCKQMKKLLDLADDREARIDLATTWSFYFEGERYFEGTRSLRTTSGIDKPVLNAYRLFAKLGGRRLGASSDAAWSLTELDDTGRGLPEEVDLLATISDAGEIAVLVWRHVDDQYLDDGGTETAVSVALDNLPSSAYTVAHFRIDRDHSNGHTVWRGFGSPQDPSDDQLRAIHERMGLETYEADRLLEPGSDRRLDLVTRLPLPSASLLVLTPAGETR